MYHTIGMSNLLQHTHARTHTHTHTHTQAHMQTHLLHEVNSGARVLRLQVQQRKVHIRPIDSTHMGHSKEWQDNPS